MAALASYLDARAHQGQWFVRIDDIDPPRQVAGAVESILASLSAHGLEPDYVDYQSQHSSIYAQALAELEQQGLLFSCRCTRSTLGDNGICTSGCCRQTISSSETVSLRVAVAPSITVAFDDLILGHQWAALGKEQANFIVRRRDGLYAYQLAAACDDGNQAVTHAIRGVDLMDSTYRQIYLQTALGLKPPAYGHLPLVYGVDGIKLSKQTGAKALDNNDPTTNLAQAAAVLGLPPAPRSTQQVNGLLAWWVAHWRYDRVAR